MRISVLNYSPLKFRSRGSSLSLRATDWGPGWYSRQALRFFSPRHSVQTGTAAHPAS